MNTIVVGLQHGDEGKGKICDYLMETHDVCVRYSGGPNTGATVWVDGKMFKFHHLPVGILRNKPNYIASDCLIDVDRFLTEVRIYEQLGFENNLIRVSPDCNIITHDHVMRDTAAEGTDKGVGSTKRGISPCTADKHARLGIRAETVPELQRYLADVPYELNARIEQGQSILFEGSQGTMLDINHGFTYPHISTTSNVAGAACASAGVGPTKIDSVIGVFKAYLTKVGSGPFPTQVGGDLADMIVERGNEYGTTTGRRRMVGWLDMAQLNYAIRINGCTQLALTKLDIFSPDDKMFFAAFYKDMAYDGQLPVKKNEAFNLEPYLLETNQYDFIGDITRYLDAPISYLATGKERKDMIDYVRNVLGDG